MDKEGKKNGKLACSESVQFTLMGICSHSSKGSHIKI